MQNQFALWELGFRPFFLMAGFSALFLILYWVLFFQGQSLPANYYSPFLWHGHELIFGYAIAVIAGFLLTAVRNWTGLETAKHKTLAALLILWFLGRILPLFATMLDHRIIAFVDILFLPSLAIVLGIPLIKSRNYRNLFFLPIFAIFTLCNLVIHLNLNGLIQAGAEEAQRLSIGLVIIIITVVGGRVIPFFSKSALPGYTFATPDWLNNSALISMIAFVLSFSFLEEGHIIISATALIAAVVNLYRLSTWYDHKIWLTPLLWVLHLSYAWIIIGLILFFLQGFIQFLAKPGLHAITIGTIASITLGMMVRVSLGHTGRALSVPNSLVAAFVMINISAFLRVFLPIFLPELYTHYITASGIFWLLSYGIFLVTCGPILIKPRIDGKPG